MPKLPQRNSLGEIQSSLYSLPIPSHPRCQEWPKTTIHTLLGRMLTITLGLLTQTKKEDKEQVGQPKRALSLPMRVEKFTTAA